MDLRFTVGNRYRKLKEGEYKTNSVGTPLDNEWTAFIRLLPIEGIPGEPKDYSHKLIDRVTLRLHETFAQPLVRPLNFNKKDCEHSLKMVAYGWFDLPITVHFKEGLGMRPVSFDHRLHFRDTGRWRNVEC